MNKAELKTFAVSARKLLVNAAISRSGGDGTDGAERAAYLWFARFTALRCMEAGGYLPRDLPNTKENFAALCDWLGGIMPEIFPVFPGKYSASAMPYDALAALAAQVGAEWFARQEVVGWLYQYYNGEAKEQAFALLRDGGKILKAHLAAATRVFTPEWIVKYLVQNSLGAVYAASGGCTDGWEYYADGAPQPAPVTAATRITLADPCVGCGFILLYAFDVFMEIYLSEGWDAEEAAVSILRNNLYGMDIDGDACGMARFALMLKARRYGAAVFDRVKTLNIIAIREDGGLFRNAGEYGSLARVGAVPEGYPLAKQAELLSRQYDVVVTNPPYMGKKSLSAPLREFLDARYPAGKSELYAAFIVACAEMTREGGVCAMVTIHSWMFLSSFENLRAYVLERTTIASVAHTGAATFETLNAFNALAAAFCLIQGRRRDAPSVFIRLTEYYTARDKPANFHNAENRYVLEQDAFNSLPKRPFIYWISENVRRAFREHKPLGDYCALRQGLATGDNGRFVRRWYEVPREEIAFGCADVAEFHRSGKKYAPYNKGGGYRKWYGCNEFVIKFDREHYALLSKSGNCLPSRRFYFQEGITWSLFGFENFSVRCKPRGFVFDVSGASAFHGDDAKYILAFLASKVAFLFLSAVAPTVNFQVGNVAALPLIIDESKRARIERAASENIALSKADWDSFELSWDFAVHPLLQQSPHGGLIADAYARWDALAKRRYDTVRANEEEINRLFIEMYGLRDELSPDVAERDVSVRTAVLERDVKSLISYGAGCLLGRYGDGTRGVLPLTDAVADAFAGFIAARFGERFLEQNLAFVADALRGGNASRANASARAVIRDYLMKDFYKEHVKIYKKHPVYRLVDWNGGKALFFAEPGSVSPPCVRNLEK
ncbi:MAG: N-6 DNA methylase [Clostridiales bacterium]|nr:N-6 DNA methylase [Clostridiales bacterium]